MKAASKLDLVGICRGVVTINTVKIPGYGMRVPAVAALPGYPGINMDRNACESYLILIVGTRGLCSDAFRHIRQSVVEMNPCSP
eukprot:3811054-Rhodomonas_salina.1